MARYNYDVNTTSRYIDVHKQFSGGLKTVDTDDALGAVYLRNAENVSLSEFGFIEKRYGTYAKQSRAQAGTLQGYFEFTPNTTTYRIYFVDGYIYVNDGSTKFVTSSSGIKKETEDSDSEYYNKVWRYPVDLDLYPFDSKFPNTEKLRDINGVQVGKVLYIFTGKYPIYAKEVNNTLRFYWFSIDIPSYDEIVVVGHNLLEEDYEEAYEFTGSNTTITNSVGVTDGDFYIKNSNWYPQFPYIEEAVDGDSSADVLKFNFAYNRSALIDVDGNSPYYSLELDNVSFAPAGSTASDQFTRINPNAVSTEIVNTNNTTDIRRILFTASEFEITNKSFDETNNSFRFSAVFDKNLHYQLYITKNGGIVADQKTPAIQVYLITSDTRVALEKDVHNGYVYFKVPEEYFTQNKELFNISITTGLDYDTEFDDFELNQYYYVLPRDSKLTEKLYNVEVENLLAGSWDFKFVFRLYKLTNGNCSFVEVEHTVFNINITPEKIQDRPGDEGVAVEPKAVWSCNRVIEHFGKLMVWGSLEMPNSVFYSFPDRPTYFPTKFYLDFGTNEYDPVQAISSYMNILVVQSINQTWGVRGNSGYLDSPAPYTPFTINPTVGAVAWKSVRPVRNHLFFLSKQGIVALKSLYAADEQYNIDFMDRNIRNIVPEDEDAVGIQFDNQYWLNFPNYGITLRWYIDKKAWVKDTFGGYKNNYTGDIIDKPGAWDQYNGVFKYQIFDGKLEYITHPSQFSDEGLAIYKVGVDYSLPTDLFGDVIAFFETSFLNQNYPFHPKNYKETKLDFTIQNEYNLGRDSIYEMDAGEDVQGNIHTIDSPALLRNHKYQITYSFLEYQLDTIDAGTDWATATEPDISGGDFGNESQFTVFINGYYFNLFIEAVLLGGQNIPFNVKDTDGEVLEIFVPSDGLVGQDLVIIGTLEGYDAGATLIDSTYDYLLDFRTWVVSEDQTLNLDNLDGYDQSKAEIPIQIGAKFGDWQFGLTDFGNKVTAVKTIKLSGKGYNAKVYFEDYSKSKWTLESLGITFKMKRARSR